ncbi:hypothetical protein H9660_09725 [Clostridium sp. Sa3CUN1]|uniref:Uncharacterized protein n=1 Tax=Clostridium gallinarum TaxID=2762246 RepID=A0ABR8Q4R7_9CLOT|nr:hypothetical protein [Clostridium gallinarum]MBD7915427.1 hypothetical protein [Clostridium gallinarum]
MESKIIKCTFDRKTGVLLNEEVYRAENRSIYIDPVINILLKGLIEYINNKKEEERV